MGYPSPGLTNLLQPAGKQVLVCIVILQNHISSLVQLQWRLPKRFDNLCKTYCYRSSLYWGLHIPQKLVRLEEIVFFWMRFRFSASLAHRSCPLLSNGLSARKVDAITHGYVRVFVAAKLLCIKLCSWHMSKCPIDPHSKKLSWEPTRLQAALHGCLGRGVSGGQKGMCPGAWQWATHRKPRHRPSCRHTPSTHGGCQSALATCRPESCTRPLFEAKPCLCNVFSAPLQTQADMLCSTA